MKKLILTIILLVAPILVKAEDNFPIVVPDSVGLVERVELATFIRENFIPSDKLSDTLHGEKGGSFGGSWVTATNTTLGISGSFNNFKRSELESIKVRTVVSNGTTNTFYYGRPFTDADLETIRAIHPDIKVDKVKSRPMDTIKSWGWEAIRNDEDEIP